MGASCSMALLSQVSTSYPRVPRDFLPGHGHIFLLIVRIRTVYAASILLASSRMLIAAFRSLSISFPHVQRYTLSDNFSSFFIFPHLLHFLLEGKKRSTFTNFFPSRQAYNPAYSGTSRIHYPVHFSQNAGTGSSLSYQYLLPQLYRTGL